MTAAPAVSFEMSAPAASTATTERALLDRAVSTVKEKAREFARLSPANKRDLLLGLAAPLVAVSRDWVHAGCKAKGISAESPVAAEEWLGGPMVTIRNVRLLAESLDRIAATGKPPLGRSSR